VHPFIRQPVYLGIKSPESFSNQNYYLLQVRKLSAILLISIFAFSQYARQLSYLECIFSNTFKTSSTKCDCEKQAGFDKQDADQLPVSSTHTHIHLDEFFAVAREIIVNSNYKNLKSKAIHLPAEDKCEGNYPRPWQPPKA
jgi:hypothetical protein